MGRVRTKVSLCLINSSMDTDLIGYLDRQEVGQSHHRTILSQAHPRLRDQQENLR
jgi:hypothetical protein